ncbi:lactate utilization protein [Halanaerobium saccharolyticum]|uniref:lactate utilization protein n=1 Tax=Halanaerobium saccharolyticum TaxID=43595 RepID=UPI003FCE5B08
MSAKKEYYRIKAENLIRNFEKRNIEAFYVKDSKAATAKVLELIKERTSVSWGGSMTLGEIGIFDKLKAGDYKLLDRATASNSAEKEKIYHQALSADYYLMSSNAITQAGELVNVDGNGNRLAALIYGPKNVIIVAGMNKVTVDQESAVKRVRNQAAPANSVRLDQKTPCAKTGYCSSCQIDDTICCQTVITRRSRQDGRIKVILVGEELGF